MSRLKTQKLTVYGGVNKKLAPHALPDDTSPLMKNFILRPTGPELAKGWGKYTSQVLTNGAASAVLSTILKFAQFFKSDGTFIQMAFTNHRAYQFRTTNNLWVPITPGNTNDTAINVSLATFVIVGSSGTNRAETSPDGVTWTVRTLAEQNTMKKVCYSPELKLFCAVSSDGTHRVQTSPDGITWTAQTAAAANAWNSVCWSYDLGLFCAVATSAVSNSIMTSPDGVTWTARTSPDSTATYTDVVWSHELGLFCAVASAGTNRVATSPDGVTWTARSASQANTWSGVAWSPSLTLFAAVSGNGANQVMTSPDGITWTNRTAAESDVWTRITWSPDISLFCAVANTGTNRVQTSSDGITWTARAEAEAELWNDVCWSKEKTLFVAVSPVSGTHLIQTSPDGTTWTARSQAENSSKTSVVWGTSTTVSGHKVVFVTSTTGFTVGDTVTINPGGGNQEDGIINSIQSGVSITMLSNLVNNHSAGEIVRRTFASALVNVDSASGQKVLSVTHTNQFTVGEEVLINLGGSREEYAIIASIQAGISLTMVNNLQFTHTAAQADKVFRVAALSYPNGTATGIDFDMANGRIYFTNLIDNVQEWDGVATYSSDVPNLNQVQGLAGGTRVRCKYLRVFQNALFLGNLNEGGTQIPNKVRWSAIGITTTDFDTWKNNADGSGQAGFATFISPDAINGLRQMKQELLIYRDRNYEGATYVGVPDIFDFRRVSGQGEQATGLVAPDGIDDLSDFHAFLGQDNVWITNAISQTKIADAVRDDFLLKINPANRAASKVFWDKINDELIVAFPTTNSTLCDQAYIYSFQFQKWSGPRDLIATALGRGQNISTTTWDGSTGTWDAQTGYWDSFLSNAPLILMGSNNGLIYTFETQPTKDGASISGSYYTKLTDCGLPELMKRCEKIYVGMRQDPTTNINVYLGTANFPGDTVVWSNALNMTLGANSEPFVYPDLTARYFQVRIDSNSPCNIREIELFFIPGKFK